jgi:hypothetical protein
MSSKFFTNAIDRNLFDKFKGIIENMKDFYTSIFSIIERGNSHLKIDQTPLSVQIFKVNE